MAIKRVMGLGTGGGLERGGVYIYTYIYIYSLMTVLWCWRGRWERMLGVGGVWRRGCEGGWRSEEDGSLEGCFWGLDVDGGCDSVRWRSMSWVLMGGIDEERRRGGTYVYVCGIAWM